MHLAAGGYCGEDRRGKTVFHPLPALSIGCVIARPGDFASHHDVSAALGEAKHQAKRLPGSVLFIERRQPHGSAAIAGADKWSGTVSPALTFAPPQPACTA